MKSLLTRGANERREGTCHLTVLCAYLKPFNLQHIKRMTGSAANGDKGRRVRERERETVVPVMTSTLD